MYENKKSKIWTTPLDEFKEIINLSSSLKEVLIKIGIEPQAGNYKTLNKRIKFENLNIEDLKKKKN